MNPRIENLLQISADTSEDIRQQVPIWMRFDDSDRTWEIIVKTAEVWTGLKHLYKCRVYAASVWILDCKNNDLY